MAYHDNYGRITIDEFVAMRDVSNLTSSKAELSQARAALVKLKNQASEGEGRTCEAIVNKTNQLISAIDRANASLDQASSLIQTTVNKYKQIDEELKNKINSESNTTVFTTSQKVGTSETKAEITNGKNISNKSVTSSNSSIFNFWKKKGK